MRRNIRLSLYRKARDLLAASGRSVYGEDELQALHAGTFSPQPPYVFLLHAPVDPLAGPVRPPAVLLLLEYTYRAAELGSRSWGVRVEASFLVLATSRRERDELADILASSLKEVEVYDFDRDPPVLLAAVDVEDPVESTPIALPEELGRQGTFRFAEEVGLSFEVYLPGLT
jgi:hypothetical protein